MAESHRPIYPLPVTGITIMFDAEGNYAPPDQPTPHALVVTKAFTGRLRSGFPVNIAAGTVLAVAPLGHTNVATGAGPKHPHAALIEATAEVGDVLSEAVITAGIATAATKQAAVQKFRAAEAAKPVTASLTVGKTTLTEADVAALKAMLSKPAKAAL